MDSLHAAMHDAPIVATKAQLELVATQGAMLPQQRLLTQLAGPSQSLEPHTGRLFELLRATPAVSSAQEKVLQALIFSGFCQESFVPVVAFEEVLKAENLTMERAERLLGVVKRARDKRVARGFLSGIFQKELENHHVPHRMRVADAISVAAAEAEADPLGDSHLDRLGALLKTLYTCTTLTETMVASMAAVIRRDAD